MKKRILSLFLAMAVVLMPSAAPFSRVFAEDAASSASDTVITDNTESSSEPAEGETSGETTEESSQPAEGETSGETTESSSQPAEGETSGETTEGSSQPAEGETSGETTEGSSQPAEGETSGETTEGSSQPAEGETSGETAEGSSEPAEGEVSDAIAVLVENLMACTTAEEMELIRDTMTQEEYDLLTAEQLEQIEAKYASLLPEKEPVLPQEEDSGMTPESPVIFPAVDFTNVAEFLPPVEGMNAAPMLFSTFGAKPQPSKPENSGLELDKTAEDNGNGTYTIQLEAYATGDKIITETTTEIPTDIVLVLDQSGSMDFEMTAGGSFSRYAGNQRENQKLYQQRYNGGEKNLFYELEDGSYVNVSVHLTEASSYQPYRANATNEYYYSNEDNLWAKMKDGTYQKVIVDYTWHLFWDNEYEYMLSDGTRIAYSEGDSAKPSFNENISGKVLYQKTPDPTQNEYRYEYKIGEEVTVIGTSVGNKTEFLPNLWYQENDGTIKRITALKNALNAFTGSVQKKAVGPDGLPGTADDVNHRIAVVGFGSGSRKFTNTELLIGSQEYNYNKLGLIDSHRSTDEGQFANAFQNMNETAGQQNVAASINKLEAEGATNTHYGVEMAEKILNTNSVPAGEKRNRVVIVFTDGSPTSSNGFELDVAEKAIEYAGNIKADGTTVYTVGIFDGADGSDAGQAPKKDLKDSEASTKKFIDASNWFMQQMSSNNGEPQDPSYYLSANNQRGLDSIFDQIAEQIEQGGSSTTLDEKAVIKDIIAPQFQLPAGASAEDVTLETYRCTGPDQWEQNPDALGAYAVLQEGNTVAVGGFDFAGNYVGTVTENGETTYRGSKLVIRFTVEVKPGFLGGNGVYTNETADVFEDSLSRTPVGTFPRPQVDVAIPSVTVQGTNAYLYLNGSVSDERIVKGNTAYCGGAALDLTKPDQNYGLADWQTAYVDITSSAPIQKEEFQNITEDILKEVSLTVSPRLEGTVSAQGQNKLISYKVLKPAVTWKDSSIDAGEQADFQNENFVSTEWRHNGQPVPEVALVLGSRPVLTFTFDTEETGITADTPVKVTAVFADGTEISIPDHVTFLHEDCHVPGCQWGQPGFDDCQFIVHIKSVNLTITKTADKLFGDADTFIFRVQGLDASNDHIDMEVVIKGTGSVTIENLPSGNYRITENTDWSWRYTPDAVSKETAGITPRNGTVAVNFHNTLTHKKWLTLDTICENIWKQNKITARHTTSN